MSGDSVLVTGSGTGLGRSMSLYLARRGLRVYASMPDPSEGDTLEQEARRCGAHLRVLRLDVTDAASIAAAMELIVAESGGIYGVVNNAGLGLRGYFEDLSEAEIRALFDANLFGGMAVTRAALPHMRAAGRGRVIMIGSVVGKFGHPAMTAYCSSKHAVEGFGEALALELRPLGLYVSIIEPGITNTERWGVNRGLAARALDPGSPYLRWFQEEERQADAWLRTSPIVPDDVARAVHTALTAPRPRLRYMVGSRARALTLARRYLPAEVFERLYFGAVLRRITRTPHGWNGPPDRS